jgi:hypothetical protein
MTIDRHEMNVPNFYSMANDSHPRDEGPPDHLEPSHFDRRAIHSAQAIKQGDYQTRQVTALTRALAWFLKRHRDGTLNQVHADNWNIGALEMDHAPTSMLKCRLDDFGNFLITFGEGCGS